jgi:uncharacterized membrane protein YeaQ/YmgE (transglycosylase-associated protein family)
MTAGNIFSAIIVGFVIGGLGRLVVPGRQAIGCLFTLLLGVIGAVAGAAIADAADVHAWPLVLALQVGVAAVGVAIVASAMRRPRGRTPF